MFRLPSLCFIVVAVLSFQSVAPDNDQTCTEPINIQNACKTIGVKHPEITLDFCVNSLTEASKSMQCSDRSELAAAATSLAIAHAQSTESKIEELMDQENNQQTKDCLSECMDVYNENIDRMKNSLDSINTQVYGKAIMRLRISRKASEKCQKAFSNAHLTCPSAAMNSDYSKFADMAVEFLLPQ